MTFRTLVADDHKILANALEAVLSAQPGFEVIGTAHNARETTQIAREAAPDLILLDLAMPGRSGVELIEELVRSTPGLRILIVTGHPEDQYAVQCLRAGAHGFIMKTSCLDELIDAIRRVASGERYVSGRLLELLLDPPRDQTPIGSLTERERSVMLLLASGQSVNGIAQDLCLSPKTVTTYRRRLLDKLKVETNQELTLLAYRAGLLESRPCTCTLECTL